MAEVRELGVLDPQQQDKLLEDLRQTDPALWPLMVKQVRAAVAYRRKSMDHGQTAASGAIRPVVPANELPKNVTNSAVAEEVPPQVLPLGDREEIVAANRSTGKLTPLPPPTNLAAGRRAESAKESPSKSTGTDEQVTRASFNCAMNQNETPKNISPTGNASETPPQKADWHDLMEQTIAALEAEMPDKPKTAEDLSNQARLRMLYAMAKRREDAVKPIAAAPPAMQDFWVKEVYGLSVLLDTERTPDAMSRAAEAKQHLSEAFTRIGEMAPLQVRNLSFCTKVQSYGCYTPFKKYEFLPNQEVLLYAEVDNFGIESTPKGYHTSLRSSYQILDKNGQRIADHANSTTEEYCQNPRRDFFIGYQIQMPPRINPGVYTLQLTIEDMKSQKVGQASVELTIKSGEKDKAER
jgi:hypothetical protein